MVVVGYICFSEMASQRWIVSFALLALCILMVVARVPSPLACRMDVVDEIKKAIKEINDCDCRGKFPNCPLKVKRRPDATKFCI